MLNCNAFRCDFGSINNIGSVADINKSRMLMVIAAVVVS
jgi:hypothetical protein